MRKLFVLLVFFVPLPLYGSQHGNTSAASVPLALVAAVREVAAGRRAIDPQLAVSTWEGTQNPLSTREHEVLRRAAEGAEPAEIAAAMCLSVGTVRNYLTAIVAKLDARNRVDAIKTAYDSGWLP